MAAFDVSSSSPSLAVVVGDVISSGPAVAMPAQMRHSLLRNRQLLDGNLVKVAVLLRHR